MKNVRLLVFMLLGMILGAIGALVMEVLNRV
jgi:hypothetical protein